MTLSSVLLRHAWALVSSKTGPSFPRSQRGFSPELLITSEEAAVVVCQDEELNGREENTQTARPRVRPAAACNTVMNDLLEGPSIGERPLRVSPNRSVKCTESRIWPRAAIATVYADFAGRNDLRSHRRLAAGWI